MPGWPGGPSWRNITNREVRRRIRTEQRDEQCGSCVLGVRGQQGTKEQAPDNQLEREFWGLNGKSRLRSLASWPVNASVTGGAFLEHRTGSLPLACPGPLPTLPQELPYLDCIGRLSWPLDSSWVQPVEQRRGMESSHSSWHVGLPVLLPSLDSGNNCSPCPLWLSGEREGVKPHCWQVLRPCILPRWFPRTLSVPFCIVPAFNSLQPCNWEGPSVSYEDPE